MTGGPGLSAGERGEWGGGGRLGLAQQEKGERGGNWAEAGQKKKGEGKRKAFPFYFYKKKFQTHF